MRPAAAGLAKATMMTSAVPGAPPLPSMVLLNIHTAAAILAALERIPELERTRDGWEEIALEAQEEARALRQRAERLWTCGRGHIIEIEAGTPPYDMGVCPLCTALERAERVEAAAGEWAEAWDATHGLTFTGPGPFPEIERRDKAEAALRAVLAPASEGSEPRPTVVCLCGSTRFRETFEEVARTETLAGRIVLTVNEFGNDGHPEKAHLRPVAADEKARLDELHLRKIDLADEVLILNVDGYIGESTGRELAYAREHGKRVRFLESAPAPGEEGK